MANFSCTYSNCTDRTPMILHEISNNSCSDSRAVSGVAFCQELIKSYQQLLEQDQSNQHEIYLRIAKVSYEMAKFYYKLNRIKKCLSSLDEAIRNFRSIDVSKLQMNNQCLSDWAVCCHRKAIVFNLKVNVTKHRAIKMPMKQRIEKIQHLYQDSEILFDNKSEETAERDFYFSTLLLIHHIQNFKNKTPATNRRKIYRREKQQTKLFADIELKLKSAIEIAGQNVKSEYNLLYSYILHKQNKSFQEYLEKGNLKQNIGYNPEYVRELFCDEVVQWLNQEKHKIQNIVSNVNGLNVDTKTEEKGQLNWNMNSISNCNVNKRNNGNRSETTTSNNNISQVSRGRQPNREPNRYLSVNRRSSSRSPSDGDQTIRVNFALDFESENTMTDDLIFADNLFCNSLTTTGNMNKAKRASQRRSSAIPMTPMTPMKPLRPMTPMTPMASSEEIIPIAPVPSVTPAGTAPISLRVTTANPAVFDSAPLRQQTQSLPSLISTSNTNTDTTPIAPKNGNDLNSNNLQNRSQNVNSGNNMIYMNNGNINNKNNGNLSIFGQNLGMGKKKENNNMSGISNYNTTNTTNTINTLTNMNCKNSMKSTNMCSTSMNQFGQFNYNQFNHLNQLNQLRPFNQLNPLNQLNHLNSINTLNNGTAHGLRSFSSIDPITSIKSFKLNKMHNTMRNPSTNFYQSNTIYSDGINHVNNQIMGNNSINTNQIHHISLDCNNEKNDLNINPINNNSNNNTNINNDSNDINITTDPNVESKENEWYGLNPLSWSINTLCNENENVYTGYCYIYLLLGKCGNNDCHSKLYHTETMDDILTNSNPFDLKFLLTHLINEMVPRITDADKEIFSAKSKNISKYLECFECIDSLNKKVATISTTLQNENKERIKRTIKHTGIETLCNTLKNFLKQFCDFDTSIGKNYQTFNVFCRLYNIPRSNPQRKLNDKDSLITSPDEKTIFKVCFPFVCIRIFGFVCCVQPQT